jgi:prepilin-type N-terminal cleavage/methylation domain-containing protein
MFKVHKSAKGFTLIELLVVIAIIGLLASIVLTSLSSAKGKGGDAKVQTQLKQLYTQIEKDYSSGYGTSFTGANTLTNSGAYAAMQTSLTGVGSTITVVTSGTPVSAYALYGKLVTDPTKYYCIDSNGAVSTAAPGANSVTCAGANSGPGEQSFTTAGTFSWTAPSGVTSVSVVAVGGGGGGATCWSNGGGGGGGLGWKNNIAVTPGQSYLVVVGAGGSPSCGSGMSGTDSYFINTGTVRGGSGSGSASGGAFTGDGGGSGGNGGQWSNPGGGAGGYSGNGGSGVGGSGSGGAGGAGYSYSSTYGTGAGGGVGLLGIGTSGAGGTWNGNCSLLGGQGGSGGAAGAAGEPCSAGPSAITGGAYGGGGGGSGTSYGGGPGGGGAVRIIWGVGRSFPSNAQ